MIFWLMLMGNIQADTLLIGAVISLTISLLFRQSISLFCEFRFTPAAIVAGFAYYLYFFKELIRSNLNLARIVLSPQLRIEPAIVKVRTRLKSRMGRLMLANSISLTPGTLTVEVDGEWIYVHWVQMTSDDIDEATATIVHGFERYLEVMYG